MLQDKGISKQIDGSNERNISLIAQAMPARGGGVRDWQRWAPYAAVAWSLFYAALGAVLGGERARVPLHPRNRGRRYGAAAWTVRTGRGLDRRDDGRDSCGGVGSGDAAWGAKQGAPASLHNRRSTARWGSPAAHDQP